jgi:3-phosphoshikimate 1-carboxyvinyltransferase
MCERPIGILVDALREIGSDVQYLTNEGFPPLETKGFQKQISTQINIRGDVSSQYISAIMMVSPILPHGLIINLTGKIASKPYILMTLELMKKFGAVIEFHGENKIIIKPSPYQACEFSVESDWSGASYWFSFVALAEEAEIVLSGLKPDSLQGDKRIIEIMEPLGVKADYIKNGLRLTKSKSQHFLKYDFSQCPDLGQTVIVACAIKGIEGEFTGLESLRIKETDRIAALQNELSKIGAYLEQVNDKLWKLHPVKSLDQNNKISIETYDDHRMAMAFAPLATQMNIEIRNPSVVDKSYPSFWTHLKKAGFRTDIQ